MKKNNNILKYTAIVIFLLIITFFANILIDSRIYATNQQEDQEEKTGNSVSDAKNLGENTLNPTSGVLPALGAGSTEGGSDANGRYKKFNNALYKIWGVILVVLQVASMSGIIFAGVRYMFASVDSKADMKKSMIYLVIGMVIVFAASSVVGFVTGTFDEIFVHLK